MIDTLILGPGGVKGFLELGSLYCLERKGELNGIKTYIGVSIGSLISLLLTSNFKVLDIFLEFISIHIKSEL